MTRAPDIKIRRDRNVQQGGDSPGWSQGTREKRRQGEETMEGGTCTLQSVVLTCNDDGSNTAFFFVATAGSNVVVGAVFY